MLLPVFVYKLHAQLVHTTCSVHKNVRRGPEGLELRSESDLCLFRIVSYCISYFRMFFACFSYLYVFLCILFRMFFVCVSYYFVFFSTKFEENRQNVCVITGCCWQTLFASNTMAACNLLRSFKCQKGQGSAVMSVYVYFVLFRIAFRIFIPF